MEQVWDFAKEWARRRWIAGRRYYALHLNPKFDLRPSADIQDFAASRWAQ